MAVALARISTETLSLDAHVAAVTGPGHGAIATFIGQVRDHDPSVEGEVTHLEYSAHPDAEAVLARLAGESAADDTAVAVSHRIGLLAVGEAAIVAAVASAHRADAFDTCRALVERVKAELPVWKREILADGSHTWVGIQ
ncbi:molybdenum cofactor biosynthesis protein MoaE [Demequina muriae]|uniref:Molybdenum cofactor biosynthesis protein MoaE n=1 Tax=Demequina muriae TaxID=3051664 RepID=A0ABT8GKF0_9MICO|nr:molybdenum cofactor biosynthesis protein MoaE [Demequina sp. EGI L300058]MDN4481411.1 molybdenum cofactor biosynthesis protein MoaE [Demequina sp. EGI L300058]